MSTFAAADFGSDSDNDDKDFVPTSPKSRGKSKRKSVNGEPWEKERRRTTAEGGVASGSDTATSSDDDSDVSEDDEAAAESSAAQQEAAAKAEEVRRARAAEMFRSMKEEAVASSTAQAAATGRSRPMEGERRMVEVKRKRRFAGEDIVETVSLPADNPEAIAYLAQLHDTASAERKSDAALTPIEPSASLEQGHSGTASTSSVPLESSTKPPSPPAPSPVTSAPPPRKGPPKRKPRQTLEQMAAALTGKKMTTLEKDELDANRRSGGYLQKKDFLDRVQERRDGMRDSGTR